MNIDNIIKIEQEVQNIIEEIRIEINNANIPGTKRINENISVVNFSQLYKTKIMSAEYYIPKGQADLIERKLRNCKTATELKGYIQDIIKTKCVNFKDGKYPINEVTIEILKKYI